MIPVIEVSLSAELYETRLLPLVEESGSCIKVGGSFVVPEWRSIEKASGPHPFADQIASNKEVCRNTVLVYSQETKGKLVSCSVGGVDFEYN